MHGSPSSRSPRPCRLAPQCPHRPSSSGPICRPQHTQATLVGGLRTFLRAHSSAAYRRRSTASPSSFHSTSSCAEAAYSASRSASVNPVPAPLLMVGNPPLCQSGIWRSPGASSLSTACIRGTPVAYFPRSSYSGPAPPGTQSDCAAWPKVVPAQLRLTLRPLPSAGDFAGVLRQFLQDADLIRSDVRPRCNILRDHGHAVQEVGRPRHGH